MARNRIIYASQSVWANGEILYRVQSLGTTTTFTSEDIFELGHLDIVDVVDDVPAVAVTLNTNDFGDVKTLAILAQLAPAKLDMDTTASGSVANLVSGGTYLHGASLADFAVTCGNLPGITMWAPVQAECDLGTLADNIDQTLFLDEVYVNSIEFSYTTGANATENYGAETDNKMWLLNDGRFVNYETWTVASGTQTEVDMDLGSTDDITILSTGLGFLRKDTNGAAAVTYVDESANEAVNYEIEAGVVATADKFVYYDTGSGHKILFPSSGGPTIATGDRLEAVYSADAYAPTVNSYFDLLASVERPNEIGALRQGQVELYIVDPDSGSSYDNAWRLTACTISADLTREALAELGHLSPYDRPLTLPIPITVTVDTTAGDLENWAKFAGMLTEFDADTLDDIDLSDLMAKENLILVVKVFKQTDEEAGGTGANRDTRAEMEDEWYQNDGVRAQYGGAGAQEYAMKTIIVKNLKITDEGATLDVGANMTQTFGFRANNDLFVVKGDVAYAKIAGIARNTS